MVSRHRDRCAWRRVVAAAVVVACGAATLAGCKPPVPPQQFLSRHAVLSGYNARAESIQRLWSRCHIAVDMPKFDDAGALVTGRESYSADGHFVFDKPRNLLLQGKAPFVGAVFGLLARRAAKEKELAPHPLSTAAIVVGTFVTGVAVLYLLAPALSTVAFLG